MCSYYTGWFGFTFFIFWEEIGGHKLEKLLFLSFGFCTSLSLDSKPTSNVSSPVKSLWPFVHQNWLYLHLWNILYSLKYSDDYITYLYFPWFELLCSDSTFFSSYGFRHRHVEGIGICLLVEIDTKKGC